VLAEHGVQSFVADSNMKVIDPLVTGSLALETRLEVAEEALERARTALENARLEGAALLPKDEEEERAKDAELEALSQLGRRIRWATVFVWMHPFVFFHGWKYVKAVLPRVAQAAGARADDAGAGGRDHAVEHADRPLPAVRAVARIAAEARDPGRTLPRALVLGVPVDYGVVLGRNRSESP
jgi:hypothetical protein